VEFVELVDTAALQPVRGVRVAGVYLLPEPACVVPTREVLPQRCPRRHQEVPGVRVCGFRVLCVRPRPLRQVEVTAVVGAVVDVGVRDNRLGEHHPDTALDCGRCAVVRVPAPLVGALEGDLERAVLADVQLRGGVHEVVLVGVCPGEVILALVQRVDERGTAVCAREHRLLDAVSESAAAVLDRLAGELFELVDTVLVDHLVDRVADHQTAGHPGPLVEFQEVRRPCLVGVVVLPGVEKLQVLADLACRVVGTVTEPRGLGDVHAPRPNGTGVDDVVDTAGPRDDLPLVEDGDERHYIAGVDIAHIHVVVDEDIPWLDTGALLVVVVYHVLYRLAHRVDVDDNARRDGDGVALRGEQPVTELALLFDDRCGGDLLRGFARVHQVAPQLGEHLLVGYRLLLFQLELLETGVVVG
jgi:hypothetical protein